MVKLDTQFIITVSDRKNNVYGIDNEGYIMKVGRKNQPLLLEKYRGKACYVFFMKLHERGGFLTLTSYDKYFNITRTTFYSSEYGKGVRNDFYDIHKPNFSKNIIAKDKRLIAFLFKK